MSFAHMIFFSSSTETKRIFALFSRIKLMTDKLLYLMIRKNFIYIWQKFNFRLLCDYHKLNQHCLNSCPEFSPTEFSPKEFLPNRISAERNFRRTDFSPKGIFAERKFRLRKFRRTEFLPNPTT